VSELLATAGAADRARWDNLSLGYTETWGMPELREAIATTYDNVNAADVLCFAGAEEGLYLAMQTLLGADDHAVVITPNYQAAETVALARCAVSGVALCADQGRALEQGWALDLDAVRAAVRPSTRVVSVNFPNNPTGAIPDRATWSALVEFCDERGIHVFSDEVYRGLEQQPDRALAQAADLSPAALSLNVMSKAYGLPGLRIGWIACRDRDLLSRLERAKHYTSICNSAPSEVLALIALHAREQILDRNRALIAANLPIFDAFFAGHEDMFEWRHPDGGCVAFPRYRGPDDVETMCRDLVEQAGVLLLPASIYRSELTPTPLDRFRIGVGRRDPEPGLAAWTDWLTKRRAAPRG